MTTSEWIVATEYIFRQADITTARLDALVLLGDMLGRDKAWVLAHPEYELQRSELKSLHKKIAQRIQHIPLAYIRGKVEFYGREFVVNEHVLVPRPESESMITLLVASTKHHSEITIIDIGTGSGALAITSKLELPNSTVLATDIDPACLEVAKQNALKLSANITFLRADLLAHIPNSKFIMQNSIILANLPYVPDAYPINRAAAHEPRSALYGGADGLDYYRALFVQAKEHQVKCIITESLLEQHSSLATIAQGTGYSLTTTDGLAQLYST
ncbi:peptide chain release factor N(5)-glutamine methyltransferase [Candidatus Saccharibacteria bacterium]|nr:MAG: peptide chain release factor N(5)-glutamine methyltransferase [Candidatus Saccharibacteria bacterium]